MIIKKIINKKFIMLFICSYIEYHTNIYHLIIILYTNPNVVSPIATLIFSFNSSFGISGIFNKNPHVDEVGYFDDAEIRLT
jgi:hypothetical protein